MVFLETSDNKRIAASFTGITAPKGYYVLLHMMPATKSSWQAFSECAAQHGLSSIAIDLRGHGRSEGGPEGYSKFKNHDHQKSIYDVDAAVKFLTEQGADTGKITLVGASIGANLALKYIVNHPEIKTAVLLSAGINYKGIETKPLVKKLRAGQRVMFIAARDDERALGNNAMMNETLYNLSPKTMDKKLVILKHGGHGTDMLESAENDISEEIFSFSISA